MHQHVIGLLSTNLFHQKGHFLNETLPSTTNTFNMLYKKAHYHQNQECEQSKTSVKHLCEISTLHRVPTYMYINKNSLRAAVQVVCLKRCVRWVFQREVVWWVITIGMLHSGLVV